MQTNTVSVGKFGLLVISIFFISIMIGQTAYAAPAPECLASSVSVSGSYDCDGSNIGGKSLAKDISVTFRNVGTVTGSFSGAGAQLHIADSISINMGAFSGRSLILRSSGDIKTSSITTNGRPGYQVRSPTRVNCGRKGNQYTYRTYSPESGGSVSISTSGDITTGTINANGGSGIRTQGSCGRRGGGQAGARGGSISLSGESIVIGAVSARGGGGSSGTGCGCCGCGVSHGGGGSFAATGTLLKSSSISVQGGAGAAGGTINLKSVTDARVGSISLNSPNKGAGGGRGCGCGSGTPGGIGTLYTSSNLCTGGGYSRDPPSCGSLGGSFNSRITYTTPIVQSSSTGPSVVITHVTDPIDQPVDQRAQCKFKANAGDDDGIDKISIYSSVDGAPFKLENTCSYSGTNNDETCESALIGPYPAGTEIRYYATADDTDSKTTTSSTETVEVVDGLKDREIKFFGKVKDKTGFLLPEGSASFQIYDSHGSSVYGPTSFDDTIKNGDGRMNVTFTASLFPGDPYTLNITVSDEKSFTCGRCNWFTIPFKG